MSESDVEVWRPVVGYKGVDAVSSLGPVRNLARTAPMPFAGGTRVIPERILRVDVIDDRISMRFPRDGKAVTRGLGEVVLEAFAGPCPSGQIVNYICSARSSVSM